MRAVLLTGHGGLDKLEYREDVPPPEPGSEEVLIKVGAAGVNNGDIWIRKGSYGNEDNSTAVAGWRREPMTFPRIQGSDIAGTIVGVGKAVPESRVGEHVLVDFMVFTTDDLSGARLIG